MEVERKWLVEEPPEAAMRTAGDEIDQGYLAVGSDGDEVRLRRRGERRFLTAKQGRGLVRDEFEVELTVPQYEVLWPATEGRRLRKRRRVIDGGSGLSIELDEYAGRLAGLFTAEVEFPDEAVAGGFVAPAWFGREVTDDPTFSNQRLALGAAPSGA